MSSQPSAGSIKSKSLISHLNAAPAISPPSGPIRLMPENRLTGDDGCAKISAPWSATDSGGFMVGGVKREDGTIFYEGLTRAHLGTRCDSPGIIADIDDRGRIVSTVVLTPVASYGARGQFNSALLAVVAYKVRDDELWLYYSADESHALVFQRVIQED